MRGASYPLSFYWISLWNYNVKFMSSLCPFELNSKFITLLWIIWRTLKKQFTFLFLKINCRGGIQIQNPNSFYGGKKYNGVDCWATRPVARTYGILYFQRNNEHIKSGKKEKNHEIR